MKNFAGFASYLAYFSGDPPETHRGQGIIAGPHSTYEKSW